MFFRRLPILLLVLIIFTGCKKPVDSDGQSPDRVTAEEKAALIAAGRSALLADQDQPALPELPKSLNRFCGREIILSAFSPDTYHVVAVSRKGCPAQNLQEAARKITKTKKWQYIFKQKFDQARIKVDLIDKWRPLTVGKGGQLSGNIDPGLDGLVTLIQGQPWYLLPEEALYRNLSWRDGKSIGRQEISGRLLKRLCTSRKLEADCWQKQPIFSFQAQSFIELQPGKEVIDLYRGQFLSQIPATPASVRKAAFMSAMLILKHQQEDGGLPSIIPTGPAKDEPKIKSAQHLVAAAGLLKMSRSLPDKRLDNGVNKALQYLENRLVAPAEHPDVLLVRRGDRLRLRETALALMALNELTTTEGIRVDRRRRLAEGLLLLIDQEGRFFADFDQVKTGGEPPKKQPGATGIAALALAEYYRLNRDQRVYDKLVPVIERLSSRTGIQTLPDPDLVRTLIALGRARPEAGWSEKALVLAKVLLAKQYRQGYAPFVDYNGGFGPKGLPRTASSAAVTQVLAQAAALAADRGQDQAAADLVQGAWRGADFLLARQITIASGYYLPRADKFVGGFRASLLGGDLRLVDQAQVIEALLVCADLATP